MTPPPRGLQMDERIAGEHRADRGEQHRAGGDVDAVEQVDRQRVDLLEDIAVVGEVELPRPEIAAHRVGARLDRHHAAPRRAAARMITMKKLITA